MGLQGHHVTGHDAEEDQGLGDDGGPGPHGSLGLFAPAFRKDAGILAFETSPGAATRDALHSGSPPLAGRMEEGSILAAKMF